MTDAYFLVIDEVFEKPFIELPDAEIASLHLTPEQARVELAVGLYAGRQVTLGGAAPLQANQRLICQTSDKAPSASRVHFGSRPQATLRPPARLAATIQPI